jgi:hypothetical protein
MALNTGGTFPEFVSNVMITDDAVCAHKETKKRKAVAAPSESAPPKYQTVYHNNSTYPPTSRNNTSTSGLLAHLSASTSGQHLRLYLHLCLSYACLRHRPLKQPLTTPTSIVVARATSLKSASRQRMLLRSTSPIRHVVCRRWPLQRSTVSTTPPCRIFPRVSKSSWVRFL